MKYILFQIPLKFLKKNKNEFRTRNVHTVCELYLLLLNMHRYLYGNSFNVLKSTSISLICGDFLWVEVSEILFCPDDWPKLI